MRALSDEHFLCVGLVKTMIPCSEVDYLDNDPPVRGQSYACVSFLSPEDVLVDKHVFLIHRYLDRLRSDVSALLDGVVENYPKASDGVGRLRDIHESFLGSVEMMHDDFRSFCAKRSDLHAEFDEGNGFRTSVRGIKIRGVYDTLAEAQGRSEVLKSVDRKHNIYISQVGCWCPWSPDPDQIENQEYAETNLNTLMREYHKNLQSKDIHYAERVEALKQKAMAQSSTTIEEVDDTDAQLEIGTNA